MDEKAGPPKMTLEDAEEGLGNAAAIPPTTPRPPTSIDGKAVQFTNNPPSTPEPSYSIGGGNNVGGDKISKQTKTTTTTTTTTTTSSSSSSSPTTLPSSSTTTPTTSATSTNSEFPSAASAFFSGVKQTKACSSRLPPHSSKLRSWKWTDWDTMSCFCYAFSSFASVAGRFCAVIGCFSLFFVGVGVNAIAADWLTGPTWLYTLMVILGAGTCAMCWDDIGLWIEWKHKKPDSSVEIICTERHEVLAPDEVEGDLHPEYKLPLCLCVRQEKRCSGNSPPHPSALATWYLCGWNKLEAFGIVTTTIGWIGGIVLAILSTISIPLVLYFEVGEDWAIAPWIVSLLVALAFAALSFISWKIMRYLGQKHPPDHLGHFECVEDHGELDTIAYGMWGREF